MKITSWPIVSYLRPATQKHQWLTTALAEIAVIGRSNVGKSSLLNHLAQQKLLRCSNSPGRTQMIHWLGVGHQGHLVDLPGYGYAKTNKTQQTNMKTMISDYVLLRPNLIRIIWLCDARRGLTAQDEIWLKLLEQRSVPFIVVWTKWDTLNQQQKSKYPMKWPENLPKPELQLQCSTRLKLGIEPLQQLVVDWLNLSNHVE